MSLHFLFPIRIKFTSLVDDDSVTGLAFATGFPEAFSSSRIGMAKERLNLNFNTVSSVVIANFYVRDKAESFIALDPPFDVSSFLISRHRIFSA